MLTHTQNEVKFFFFLAGPRQSQMICNPLGTVFYGIHICEGRAHPNSSGQPILARLGDHFSWSWAWSSSPETVPVWASLRRHVLYTTVQGILILLSATDHTAADSRLLSGCRQIPKEL